MKVIKSGENIGAMQLQIEEGDRPVSLEGKTLDLSDMRIELEREMTMDYKTGKSVRYVTRNIEVTADWWTGDKGSRVGVTTQITLTPQQYAMICEAVLQNQVNIAVVEVMEETPVSGDYLPGLAPLADLL